MTKKLFSARYGWLIRLEMKAMRSWGQIVEQTLRDDFGDAFEMVRDFAWKAAFDSGDANPSEKAPPLALDEFGAHVYISTTLDELRTKLEHEEM